MTDKMKAAADFAASDAAWWEQLVMHFGDEATAQHFRYTSLARGDEGSDLRIAYDCRAKAHDAWIETCNAARVVAA
jgi:hypothetical protein